MSKPKVLIQLDGDAQPSVFDAVVAVDCGALHLLRHGNVVPETVEPLVYGAMFTRAPDELRDTAIFIGGSDLAAGEALLAAVQKCFFGPMRVSVMLDANGANTTAAAAVLAAARHVELAGASVLVLAATGPVGVRVVRLLARQGADVRVASRSLARAEIVCFDVAGQVDAAKLRPCEVADDRQAATALSGADVVIAAGAAGVPLLSAAARAGARSLKVAIDLNAVPPAGLEGVDVTDAATERDGILCYGAVGTGSTKMKIHKQAIRRLYETNNLVLDAEEIFEIGRELQNV